MNKLAELKAQALQACWFRGHDMSPWKETPDGRHHVAHCRACDMQVSVTPRPAPNEIDVGGEAVALTCLSLCDKCGWGPGLHGADGSCPEPYDKMARRCPYCGGWGAFRGQKLIGGPNDAWEEEWRCLGDCGEVYRIAYDATDFLDDGEDVPPPLIDPDPDLPERDRARLEACLDKVWRFELGTMSLRRLLLTAELTHKTRRVRTRSRRKVDGCYPELKNPVTEYFVWAGDTGWDVAKLVWDALTLKEED